MDLKQVKTEHEVLRKRGRPAGKNRVPLSNVERRARNAQYERERRNEMADALADLAKALDCESSITNQNLLVTVVAQLRRNARRKPGRDADSLRRCNESLKSQIAALEQQLNLDLDDGSAKFSSAPRGEQTDELHRLESGCSPLPEYSSPERKYSPPLAFSSGQESLIEELPSLNRVSEPVRDYIPCCHGVNSPKRELMTFEESRPPPGDQSMPEHGQLDLSSYQFADEQVPTPEYRITSESPDSIVPEPQHFLCQEVSPSQSESPSLKVLSEPHSHDPYLSQPLLFTRAPNRRHNDTMAGLHVRNEFISPGFNEGSSTADFDRRVHFLSTEDLISVYLPS